MSLLMEALKKAEQARRKSGDAASPQEPAAEMAAPVPPEPEQMPELTLEPPPVVETPAERPEPPIMEEAPAAEDIPALSLDAPPVRTASVEVDAPAPAPASAPAAHSVAEPAMETTSPRPVMETPQVARQAARTVFTAKQPAGRLRRERIIQLAVLGVLIAVAGSSYLYYLYQSLNTSAALSVVAVGEVVGDVPADEPVAAVDAVNALAVVPAVTPLVPQMAPQVAAPVAGTVASPPDQNDSMTVSVGNAPAMAITITRTTRAPRSEPLLLQAYEAYQANDIETAHRTYWTVLRGDPNNRNAMFGLAAIAARNHEYAQARAFYLRLIERDPRDELALAGLLNLEAGNEDSGQESKIRQLLHTHPDAAHLHFTLGNLYAAQQRWAQAQAAYFDALQADQKSALRPEQKSPDYAFNLAVSLEHLGKFSAALGYYRQALEYAAQRQASFGRAATEERIRILSAMVE